MRLVSLALVLTAVVAPACASDLEHEIDAAHDPPPEPSPPLEPRAAADRPPPAPRPWDAVAAWGFEPASADCNGWQASGATSIRAAPPHSGAYSCKLCADGTREEIALSRRVGTLERGSYVVTAWLRRHGPSAAAVAARVALDADEPREGAAVSGVAGEWRTVRDALDARAAVASAHVRVVARGLARGECILVDDVVVATRPDVASPP